MVLDGIALGRRHARASTTLNVYGHCVPGADRDAADYIAGLLAGEADRVRAV